jgi:hypothetical protein
MLGDAGDGWEGVIDREGISEAPLPGDLCALATLNADDSMPNSSKGSLSPGRRRLRGNLRSLIPWT